MYKVSRAYKESMKMPIRNRSYMKIFIGLVNQEAQSSAILQSKDKYTGFSDTEGFFESGNSDFQYATYENSFFKADGTLNFIPRDSANYEKHGLVEPDLFSGSSVFRLTFSLSDIKGLSIQFGTNYPTRFKVTDSSGNETIFENDSDYFETQEVFDNTRSLTITVLEMNLPNVRFRIQYMRLGVGLVYGNDNILSTSSKSTMSVINENLPEVEFEVSLENSNQMFNVDNPDSAINFLETGQQVSVQCGYELDDGEIEWQTLHSTYVYEWSANDERATIKTVDRFKFLEGDYYKGQYYANGISLYDLAVNVLRDAGIESSEYELDTYLQDIKVKNPLPNVTHKEALQIIANAGRCVLEYTREGMIRIRSLFIPTYTTTSNGTVDISSDDALDTGGYKQLPASYQKDVFKADSSLVFSDGTYNTTVPYISKAISNEKGLFDENPTITREFEAACKIYGLDISFLGNVPSKFIIRAYLEDVLVDTVIPSGETLELVDENGETLEIDTDETLLVTNDVSNDFYLSHEFPYFDKLVFEFVETSIPHNRIQISNIGVGHEADYKIEYDDLKETPTGKQLDKTKEVNLTRTMYSKSSTVEELMTDTIEYEGEKLTYMFDEACYDYSASIVGGSSSQKVIITESGSHYCVLSISGVSVGTEIELSISGKKYNVATASAVVVINNRGTIQTWENPLISDDAHAKTVAKWLADYFASGIEYELQYRGEPALDCGDIIYQENRYDDHLKTIIEESQIEFNGALSGALLTRRRTSVDRA